MGHCRPYPCFSAEGTAVLSSPILGSGLTIPTCFYFFAASILVWCPQPKMGSEFLQQNWGFVAPLLVVSGKAAALRSSCRDTLH